MKVPLWAIYVGPGLALLSIVVSFVSNNVALFLWLLLPLRDLLFMFRVFPATCPINNPCAPD